MTNGVRSRRGLLMLGGACIAALVTLVGSAGATQRYVELASIGPDGGNGAVGTPQNTRYSDDGSRFFFNTAESLVSADTDGQLDVYERSNGQTTLVSVGQINGNGAHAASLRSITPDGSHVFFGTSEQLVAADTDTRNDIYDRSSGSTTLVSVGPPGNEALADMNAFIGFNATSTDGSVVYFSYSRSQTFNPIEYFRRSGGQTIQLHANWPMTFFCGASSDGSKAWMVTPRNLAPEDTDPNTNFGGARDVYEWSGGTWTLVSTGPTVAHTNAEAFCVGVSSDTARVFFTTPEPLVAGDTDGSSDVYERSSGSTTLLSVGPDGGNGAFGVGQAQVTPDGSHLFFTTQEALVAATDTDTSVDVYERSSGLTTHVSLGPGGGNGDNAAQLVGVSADGTRAYFSTTEPLVGSDTDTSADIYERSGGLTRIATQGSAGGNGPFDPAGAFGAGSVLGDGGLLFSTEEGLVGADTDGHVDIYEWDGVATRLVSVGGAGGNGAFHVAVDSVSKDGSRVAFRTQEALVAADTDEQFDLYDATVVPDDGGTQTVPPGGTASTGGTPSPADPVETSVTTPVGGEVTITETEATGSPPAGFELLGMAVDITADPATAANPLTLAFRLDGSLLIPAGLDHTTVQVLKDGVQVAECDAPPPPADPDPCVAQRSPLAGGGAEITVSTSTASLWGFARGSTPTDTTPPVITPSVTGTLGSNGWYVSNVEVSWTVDDPESAISSQTGCDPTTVNADTTGLELTCEATSAGGTTSSSVDVKRDATDPTVTCAVGGPGPVFVLAGPGGNVVANVTDGTSTPASATVAALAVVTSVGNRTVQLTGMDRAGNDATAACPYRVSYVVVSKSPGPGSSKKAGSTITVKFGLANASGARVSDAAAQALVASCKVKVGLDSATGCATYNTSSDTFQFDVKTPKNGAGNHALVTYVFAPDGSGLVNRETTPVVLT